MRTRKGVIQITERVQRCGHCRAEMKVGALAYAENPYCVLCLDERVLAATGPGEVSWRTNGHYVEFFKQGR